MKKILALSAVIAAFSFSLQAQVKKPVARKKPLPAKTGGMAASIVRGKVVYTSVCLPCHMADGGGVMNLNPPLIKTEYVLGDKTRLVNILLKGFNERIEIEEQQYSNPMPAVAHLSDTEIADVLTYVRNNFGNKAPAVSPLEVKTIRAAK
ncbi:c-type cytochrome [Hufsiella ginkgonis]|uniref:C-type cytochrome n=1 Tax=Hufsiella ginkgonis TaxID=2695274 RepID=A0A7K1Y107_9SPHI|nr:cytochrome c [Hufsiella ginkgonis]MXV16346.1 c-type cytochrome [Hufsiella ginkgonis]